MAPRVRTGRFLRGAVKSWRLTTLLGAVIAVTSLVLTILYGHLVCLDRGRLHLDARQHDAARRWLEWGEFLNDDSAEIHFQLARAYRRLRRFDDVERHLKRADVLGWHFAQLEREQLMALAQDGQYDAVEGRWGLLLNNAGSDAPEIAEAYVTERLSKFMVQDAQVALDAWEADYPADPQPRFWRGKMLEALGFWSDATNEYGAALALAPDRLDIRLRVAQGLMRQMSYDNALAHLKICVSDKSSNADATIAYAQCLNKLGRSDESRQILQRELAREPQNLAALRELAEQELAADQPENALAHTRRALEIEPVDRELHYLLARALQRLGQTSEAQREFAVVNEATKPVLRLAKISPELAKNPGNVALRFEVAETTWKYKSRVEGARWLHSVLEFDPRHAQTHRLLAEHYELLGNHELAELHRSMLKGERKDREESP